MIYPVPKPPKKKKKKPLNNPKPTVEDRCRYCCTPYASTHEVFDGNGRRQLSIKYGMQVKLCIPCHKDIQEHPLQGRDLELKKEFQGKFEETHSRDEFIRVFGKSYL